MMATAPSRRATMPISPLPSLSLLQRLHRVAAKIAQHPIELVAVGVDLESLLDVDGPIEILARQPEAVADLGDQRGERKALAPRRHFMRLAEIERAGAQPDGAVERGDQLRHQALHGRVLDRDQSVGQELRARQHVAQIVADLAHRQAERGEPVPLRQGLGELLLHRG